MYLLDCRLRARSIGKGLLSLITSPESADDVARYYAFSSDCSFSKPESPSWQFFLVLKAVHLLLLEFAA